MISNQSLRIHSSISLWSCTQLKKKPSSSGLRDWRLINPFKDCVAVMPMYSDRIVELVPYDS